jgi:uncharacterized protein
VILVDTNVIVAATLTADVNHRAAAELLETTTERLLVPPTVIAEACYLLNEWGGPATETRFLRSFGGDGLELAELLPDDLGRMAELVEQYGDMPLGGTDASVVAIAERRDITHVATFDRRHFTVVRASHVDALTLLP